MCGMSSIASSPPIAALDDALGQHARGGAVGDRHAVADEQDDVLRLCSRRAVDPPAYGCRLVAVPGLDRELAGRELSAAYPVRRSIVAVFLLGEDRLLAEHPARVAAVDQHLNGSLPRSARELDLEVEARAHQDLGLVYGIDGLR